MLKPGAEEPIILAEIDVCYVKDEKASKNLESLLKKYETVFEGRIGCVNGFEHKIKI